MQDAIEADYIVVGAGSAGCVLAARLSEDPGTHVLVVEAGGWDNDPYIRIPLAWGRLFQHRMHDWGYDTLPEPRLGGRVLDCARGKVVGGSSSTNAMAYGRGHPADYDRWAAMGARGWNFAGVLPYFRRAESWEEGETAYRGGAGPLTTIRSGLPDPLVAAWFAGARGLGWPVTEDTNAERQEGFAVPQWTVRRGRRCSAADAYLKPALDRPNLRLLTHTLAVRILFDGRRAAGLEMRRGGRVLSARARREVILAAGAINSPQLLQVSGVGPAGWVRTLGVPVVADLPGVGRNMHDHMSVPMEYARRGRGWFQRRLRWDRFALMLAEGLIFGTGPTAGLPMGCVAFMRSSRAGAAADLALLFRASAPVPRQYPPFADPGPDGVGYRVALMQPESRGWVRARSPDAAVAPEIVQNFLESDRDLVVMREGLKMIRRLNATPEVAPFIGSELTPGPGAADDAALDAHIRATATTVHHPVGSCRMGAADDPMAVVTPDLRVRGVGSLRVIDASVMPAIVSGPTNAPTIMIAEKGADLLRGRPAPG